MPPKNEFGGHPNELLQVCLYMVELAAYGLADHHDPFCNSDAGCRRNRNRVLWSDSLLVKRAIIGGPVFRCKRRIAGANGLG